MSVGVQEPCSSYQNFSVVQLNVRHGDSTREVLLLLTIVFAILGFFIFPDEFATCPF